MRAVRAAIYIRVSTDEQAREGFSIDAQLRILRAWCVVHGYDAVTEYTDDGYSAKNLRRPAVLRLLNDCRAGKVDLVLVWRIDRLFRSMLDMLTVVEEIFRRNNVEFVSATENIDTTTPSGRLMLNILGSFAQNERENTAQRVGMVMTELAKQGGRRMGGAPLYGYTTDDDNKYVIDTYEAEGVRMLFRMKRDGAGYGEIIATLTRLGYLTRKGTPFGVATLHDMLRNPRYCGVYVYNRVEPRRSDGSRNNRKSRPDSEIVRVDGGNPAIVSKQLWEEVQKIMDNNGHMGGQYLAKNVYILSGLVYCGCCGSRMPIKNMGRGRDGVYRRAYQCPNRCTKALRYERGADAVLDFVTQLASDPHLLSDAIAMATQFDSMEREDIAEDIEAQRASLVELNAQRNNLLAYIAKVGAEAGASIAPEVARISGEMEAIKNKIAALEVASAKLDTTFLTQRVSELLYIKSAQPADQKRMLRDVVESVTVHDDKLDIKLRTTAGGDSSVSPSAVVLKFTIFRPDQDLFEAQAAPQRSLKGSKHPPARSRKQPPTNLPR